MLSTIETVADLSYAWHALAGYKEATCGQYVPAKRPIRWEEGGATRVVASLLEHGIGDGLDLNPRIVAFVDVQTVREGAWRGRNPPSSPTI